FPSTAEIREYGRKLAKGNRNGDIYESVVWRDKISVNYVFLDRPLYLISIPCAVHQEAIIIPDNIDAIRSLNSVRTAEESRAITDFSLSIGKGWRCQL
ncbi:hypothetical protein ACFL0V_07000, partial [Nanoarchaeota archaeon]